MPSNELLSKFNPKLKQIPIRHIIADPLYNRRIDKKKVDGIINEFDATIFKPIDVSHRDGKLYVFDGNHRVTVARTLFGEDAFIWAFVYEGMTQKDEAYYFTLQDGISSKPGVKDNFKAGLISGDEVSLACAAIIDSFGLKISFTNTKAENSICCTDKIVRIYKKNGEGRLRKVLNIVVRSWGGEESSLNGEIICGVNELLNTYEDEMDIEWLIKRLKDKLARTIIKEGKNVSKDMHIKGFKKYAFSMVGCYNTNIRKPRQTLKAAKLVDD